MLRSRAWRGPVPGALVLGCMLAGLPAPAHAGANDRILDLVAEARRSPCFLAPSRPPLAQPVTAEVAVAAQGGDGAAMQRIAEAFLADPARPRQALDWLERAARAGALTAAADAGSLHAAGRGTAQDEAMAAGWWRYGATRGDARSMACLSAAYLLGRGVPQDLAQAARWALLREARAPGRLMLRPGAAEFERALPSATLAEARRLAREALEPSPPPGAVAPWDPAPPALPAPASGSAITAAQPPPEPPPGMEEGHGSAVVVGQPGLLLTSAHVVDGCAAMAIHAGYARLGGVELRALHRELDLAVLSVPGLARAPLPVRAEVSVGEEVVLIGFPRRDLQGEGATVTVGHVSALGSGADATLLQFTAALRPGGSGGPLLDRRGQVVGIAVATAMPRAVPGAAAPQAVNLAVGPATLARFLDDHGMARGAARPERAVPDIVQEATRSVVEVVCWRTKRPPATAAGPAGLTRTGR